MSRILRCVRFLPIPTLMVCLLVGCSGGANTPSVKGKVLFNGEPLADAFVTLFPGQQPVAASHVTQTAADGSFVISPKSPEQPLKPGSYRVTITKYVQKDGKAPPKEDRDMLLASGTLRNAIPSRYGSPTESSLVIEVKEGNNELQPIQLTNR